MKAIQWAVLPVLASLGAGANGQLCIPHWQEGFRTGDPLNGVRAQAVFDDGNGPALYAGDVTGVWRWDGSEWVRIGQLGTLFQEQGVHAMLVHDTGSGPRLFVGGEFQSVSGVPARNLAAWTGDTWESIGLAARPGTSLTDPQGVRSIIADGSAIVIGGGFSSVGGVSAFGVARWNGSAWSAYGAGLTGSSYTTWFVRDLSVYNGSLYATGNFTNSGSAQVRGIARWAGTSWAAVGGGFWSNGDGYALAVHNDGGGERLYLGGNFNGFATATTLRSIARWNGGAWESLPGIGAQGLNGSVYALYSDQGPPAGLIMTGHFTSAAGVGDLGGVLRYAGGAAHAVGGGVPQVTNLSAPRSVLRHGMPGGSSLVVGGPFVVMGSVGANGIAQWDGSAWSAVGEERTGLLHYTGRIWQVQGASGPAVYIGGARYLGAMPVNGALRYDGQSWSVLGPISYGTDIFSMASYDSGDGRQVYAAITGFNGEPSTVARWTGGAWQTIGTFTIGGAGGGAGELTVYDDGAGPKLYAAGTFDAVNGTSANSIARWNGFAWEAVGQGITGAAGGYGPTVMAAEVHKGALYVGGVFAQAGGQPAVCAARYDGQWSSVGPPPPSFGELPHILHLASVSNGSGRVLVCNTNNAPTPIYRLEQGGWVPHTSQTTLFFGELAEFDAGDGPMLCTTGGAYTNGYERLQGWTGSEWRVIGGGIDGSGFSLAAVDLDGQGGEASRLWLTGTFHEAGGVESSNIAILEGCAGLCYANCDGSVQAPVLNVADFSCFLQAFAAGDPRANCDRSTAAPVLNVADFTCFLQRYAAGCP